MHLRKKPSHRAALRHAHRAHVRTLKPVGDAVGLAVNEVKKIAVRGSHRTGHAAAFSR